MINAHIEVDFTRLGEYEKNSQIYKITSNDKTLRDLQFDLGIAYDKFHEIHLEENDETIDFQEILESLGYGVEMINIIITFNV